MSQILSSINELTTSTTAQATEEKYTSNKTTSSNKQISYSKEFLLGLQFAPSSLVKPEIPNFNFVCQKVSYII